MKGPQIPLQHVEVEVLFLKEYRCEAGFDKSQSDSPVVAPGVLYIAPQRLQHIDTRRPDSGADAGQNGDEQADRDADQR